MNTKCKFRSLFIQEIRNFFFSQGFLETDTPTLVCSPGMEPHIRPFQVKNHAAFLPTSPEFAMKRLLARGCEKIFQICKAYRNEPVSSTHYPEFTILEWYRSHSDYEQIMTDVEQLFCHLAKKFYGSHRFQAMGTQDVNQPWPRFTIEECFRKFAELELTKLFKTEKLAQVCIDRGWASPDILLPQNLNAPGAWDDLFFRVMLNAIEPKLSQLGQPVLVYLYPESQAALSNIIIDKRGCRWAKRFEVYAGGLELGNAFDELTDSTQQRVRFIKDMALRKAIYGNSFPPNPIDEEFLADLSKMPASSGIAMGVDRMVMYFTATQDIRDVLWLESFGCG